MSIDSDINIINGFQGRYLFLSNYGPGPADYDGVTYLTAEHAYHAAKTLDQSKRDRIRQAPTAHQAKKLGSFRYRTSIISSQDIIASGFDQNRHAILEEILRSKFSRPNAVARLLATGDAILIDGPVKARFGTHNPDPKGNNTLGKLLMTIRSELR